MIQTKYFCDRCRVEMGQNYYYHIIARISDISLEHFKGDICKQCRDSLVKWFKSPEGKVGE